jgi:hypothetical protein
LVQYKKIHSNNLAHKLSLKIALNILLSLLLIHPVIGNSNPEDDKRLYDSSCAACHGADGTGKSQIQLGFEIAPPDFSDCEFASREPDPDWHAVIHEGGPIRAFDKMMPAFGSALTDEEIYDILRHVRTFCENKNWPPGEFNLPRPLFTEKAFVEDETVITTSFDAEGPGAMVTDILYEKRFGARHMVEIEVPIGYHDLNNNDDWDLGVGDITLGYKHASYHNLDAGRMLSLGVEVKLPTGDEDSGLGKGTTVFEPYVAFAQLLPGDSFLQLQGFAEFPTESNFNDEAGFKIAIGKTITEGEFGRAWSPMLEALVIHEFGTEDETNVDLVPQFQVSLNTRQHILVNIGARIPVTNTETRDTQIVMYLLWDWFDGGFFDGW